MKKRRIFVAINFPNEIKRYLAGFQKKCSDLPARWTAGENLHITLVFLGYLKDVEVGEVCLAAKEVSQKHNSFSINLNKISYGPLGKLPPQMVLLNGQKSSELSILKKDLENFFAAVVRYKPENRSFNPHVTLARIKTMEWRQIEPEERQEIDEKINLNLPVESIEVMESVLKRTGPEYSIIESFQLAGLRFD